MLGDRAGLPPRGWLAGCWAVARLPGCGMAPECVADVLPPPRHRPLPSPATRRTLELGCTVQSGRGPQGAGDAGGWFSGCEGSAGQEMLCRPPPLAGMGVHVVAAWFSCSLPHVRPSVQAGVVPALPQGHTLSDALAGCACWRAGIWSRGTFPRHTRTLGTPSLRGLCMQRGHGVMRSGCLLGSGYIPTVPLPRVSVSASHEDPASRVASPPLAPVP